MDRLEPGKKGSKGKKIQGKQGKTGIFHQFPVELQHALVSVAIQDAPATRSRNNEDIESQQREKVEKEEILKEKGMEKASVEMAKAIRYFRMYDTDACWKGDPKVVALMLKRIRKPSLQREGLITNINMRVVGQGLDQWKITFTHKREKRSLKELANHLRKIIRLECSDDYVKPTRPPTKLEQRKPVPILGTMTNERRQLDIKHNDKITNMAEVATKLANERGRRKDRDSMYAAFQPFEMPTLQELNGKRIDVLWPMRNDEVPGRKQDLQWCQGLVMRTI